MKINITSKKVIQEKKCSVGEKKCSVGEKWIAGYWENRVIGSDISYAISISSHILRIHKNLELVDGIEMRT
jgi:hypothetical protein